MSGGTTSHFVTDGIHAALERAVHAANGRYVRLGGGSQQSDNTFALDLWMRCTWLCRRSSSVQENAFWRVSTHRSSAIAAPNTFPLPGRRTSSSQNARRRGPDLKITVNDWSRGARHVVGVERSELSKYSGIFCASYRKGVVLDVSGRVSEPCVTRWYRDLIRYDIPLLQFCRLLRQGILEVARALCRVLSEDRL